MTEVVNKDAEIQRLNDMCLTLQQQVSDCEEKVRRMTSVRVHLNNAALDVACEVDNVYAQGHANTTARTSKVAVVIREAMRVMLTGDEHWGSPSKNVVAGPRRYIERAQPIKDYHEDMSYVVWWRIEKGVPAGEPAYIGSPVCDNWVDDYYTHFTPHPTAPDLRWKNT